MEIAFQVDKVYQAAQANRKEGKPVFPRGWYLGWIEQVEKVEDPTGRLEKVVLGLVVHERSDRQGRSREINAHLCFGHRDALPRKLAYEGLADIGYATGAVVRKPDGSQAVSLDKARGKPMGVRLVVKPHRFTPQDGPNAGQTLDMQINRVNGFGNLDKVPEPPAQEPPAAGDGEFHPTATAQPHPDTPVPTPEQVRQMQGNPMGEYVPPGPPPGYGVEEDIPF